LTTVDTYEDIISANFKVGEVRGMETRAYVGAFEDTKVLFVQQVENLVRESA
jgi:hypothetical protein